MIKKGILSAVAALSLLSASNAVAAGQASSLSLDAGVRAGAAMEDSNSMAGGGFLLGILGLGVLALFIFVADDDDDAPASP